MSRRNRFALYCAALFVLWMHQLLGAVLIAGLAVWCGWQLWSGLENERAKKQWWVDRADTQHAQVLAGDERGVYGAGYETVREFRAHP